MYESVRGPLIVREPTRCVVEAGGFGYSIAIPVSTFERLPRVGDEVALRLHLVIPERGGDWRLFGFFSDEERSLFRACLKVSGVGPATALALLSGMAAKDLRAAVSSGDVKSLTRVKGIGKKTAERLVIELRDALEIAAGGAAPGLAGSPTTGPLSDAAAALVALGVDAGEAHERLRRIPEATALPVSELVRRALRGG